jgi:hypothetical protein
VATVSTPPTPPHSFSVQARRAVWSGVRGAYGWTGVGDLMEEEQVPLSLRLQPRTQVYYGGSEKASQK